MVLSGIASAFIFAPSLLLVSDLVRRGNGEGLFGIFQIAGSLGFLAGPIAGGVLVALTGSDGRPAYESIFAMVGVAELALALGSVALLRGLCAEPRGVAVRSLNSGLPRHADSLHHGDHGVREQSRPRVLRVLRGSMLSLLLSRTAGGCRTHITHRPDLDAPVHAVIRS